MDWDFNVPVKTYEYELEEFKERLGKYTKDEYKNTKIVLIASKRLIKTFELENLISEFTKNESFKLIDVSIANPDTHLIHEIFNQITEKPDLIISIGGGSTIDFAKAISGLYSYSDNGKISIDEILDLLKTKEYTANTDYIPIIAAPTTSGTGSECTKWATIWDFDNSKKYSIDADYLYPIEAWLVPELTATLPPRLTLATSLDALSHAVEAYWSKSTNKIIQILARDAIKLVVKYLPLTLNDLENIEYREKLMFASFFAGLAFSNTRTTACHSISYPLTMKFGIEHGFAVNLTLIEVFKRNYEFIPDFDEFLEAWNAKSIEDVENWMNNVCSGVQKLKLSEFGVKEEDIDEVVDLTFTAGRMDNNPIVFSEEEVTEILHDIL